MIRTAIRTAMALLGLGLLAACETPPAPDDPALSGAVDEAAQVQQLPG